MALVNKNQKETIVKLVEKLMDYHKKDWFVNIHIHVDGVCISDSVIPEVDIYDDYSYIVISQGLLKIELDMKEQGDFILQHIKETDSFELKSHEFEIYFDFV